MPNAYVTEYSALGTSQGGHAIPVASKGVNQAPVVFTSSAQSAPFANATRYVRVISDAKAHIAFGTDPAATANDTYIAADAAEYFAVTPNERVAFYDGETV